MGIECTVPDFASDRSAAVPFQAVESSAVGRSSKRIFGLCRAYAGWYRKTRPPWSSAAPGTAGLLLDMLTLLSSNRCPRKSRSGGRLIRSVSPQFLVEEPSEDTEQRSRAGIGEEGSAMTPALLSQTVPPLVVNMIFRWHAF